jgi:hypothetical protein
LSTLHPPLVVFEREKQHGTLFALDIAETMTAARDSNGDIEREPRLANLGTGSEQRQALDDDIASDAFEHWKGLGLQCVG